jgi:hypothetical protein
MRTDRRTVLSAGAAALLGSPALLQAEETPAARMVRLIRGARPNVYQRSLWEFSGLCYTKDEARSRVAPMPRWDYLREIGDAIITEKLLMVAKSRRVLASWFVCITDVWLAAGGQDPRWNALMYGTGNRQIVIASRKLEGPQSSSWFLQERVRFIVEQLEARGIRERWPEFPRWEWTHTEARLSNGSRITAIAQGADQARGISATAFHVEELAHLEEAKQTIEAILPTLFAQDETAGHLVALCTAATGTYAADVYLDQVDARSWR